LIESWVKENQLRGTVLQLKHCGRQVSGQVVRVLECAGLGQIPIETPSTLAVNTAKAEHLGPKIPDDVIEGAQII